MAQTILLATVYLVQRNIMTDGILQRTILTDGILMRLQWQPSSTLGRQWCGVFMIQTKQFVAGMKPHGNRWYPCYQAWGNRIFLNGMSSSHKWVSSSLTCMIRPTSSWIFLWRCLSWWKLMTMKAMWYLGATSAIASSVKRLWFIVLLGGHHRPQQIVVQPSFLDYFPFFNCTCLSAGTRWILCRICVMQQVEVWIQDYR